MGFYSSHTLHEWIRLIALKNADVSVVCTDMLWSAAYKVGGVHYGCL